MKEIVVISGKGGTGKTSVTAAFAQLAAEESVIADCDVDAADMHLLLKPDFAHEEAFYSGQLAHIDMEKCTRCFKCKKACRFDAIHVNDGVFSVNEMDCEGCGYCEKVCPVQAITMYDALSGKTYISSTRLKNTLVHAELEIAAENSGKLVTRVKALARQKTGEEKKDFLLIDGTPGIGCPVTASVTGAHYVVIVTEPSMSGLHDLKRAIELIGHFSIAAGLIINKADLNEEITDETISYAKEQGIELLAQIPYNENFVKALTQAKTIVEYDRELKKTVVEAWDAVRERVVDH
ncbi:MAG: ATP-binding protein [Bacteroidales bacterium]|nr:ATP-binding protein [Bacteroidales bacterium]MBS3774660.1 ATP-binding protein [Bacteroidales bacterium]